MAILTINLRAHQDDDNDLALQGFPFLDDQYIREEMYGDACVVEIDLDGRDDTTTAQEQFLDTNPMVVGYDVTPAGHHKER
jgi:hypothetical protein